jgi:polyisoprenyl-teichoic acid--peptidoglycan teichoic acid transferase
MNKRRIIAFTITFLIIIGIIVVPVALATKIYQNIFVSPVSPVSFETAKTSKGPTPTPDPLRIFNVLLLGYGGGNHDGALLTDSMILAQINPRKKEAHLISIPRDIWVQLPIYKDKTQGFKINAAYAIGVDSLNYPNKPIEFTGKGGGGSMAKYIVTQISGLPVDYFVAIDFAGFTKTIDSLGGVDVSVKYPFNDPFYPIEGKEKDACGKSEDDQKALSATLSGDLLDESFLCRFEHISYPAGIQHMDGVTALKYVRSRHSNTYGGDFNRGDRQQSLIAGAKNKIFTIGFIPKIIPFISSLSGDFQTDISLDKLKILIDMGKDAGSYRVNSIELSTNNILAEGKTSDGQYVLTPKSGEGKWPELQAFIKQNLESSTSAIPK